MRIAVKSKNLSDILGRWTEAVRLLPWLAALGAACLVLHGLNNRLRPILEAEASSRAVNLMTQAIDEAVDDCLQESGMDYTGFVTVTTDRAGRVTALTSNTAANSRFKRQVTQAVARRLGALDSDALGVPLGTLTGWPPLSGAGPSVRARVDSVGEVAADYASSFTAAGIDQTVHRICLEITATVYLFLPGGVFPVSVSESVCVAESVILGEASGAYVY